ncbi:dihydroxyacetone kinase subunit DhaK [Chitinophaga nivalis]|uniref:Dihydroxyacetone kinase subunit DhaK n=1 Tax=Chitinophaga nivalis TaxID=2991709 RepID=A0ABT3IM91_9BACT|nr:dihydroxyacetone kinase subunit DhaK [Chitinophaga nivalis]MCW3465216.1 dihydroxyacetone kinase subunit DhaK [Chitinophaga nivalis]MCW3485092.1 dihydroxyacetone kinase subunit DhaK [Chitinophaga nivalis]
MKSFINKTDQIVNEAIDGLLTNPLLAKLDRFPEVRVVVRKDRDPSKVAIISGGGSGHEPAHAGFVGAGMLTAAVCGDIFASPSVDAVLSAILATTGPAGCLLIIKNYTGDRLNFGLAAEQARTLGLQVRTVTVDDDIALGTAVKRRGLAGTLFVHKIAGQLAEAGYALDDIATIAQQVIDQTISIGLSLTECQHLGHPPTTRLKEDQVELGLGIHGEPGIEVIPYAAADQLMDIAVNKLAAYLPDTNGRYAMIFNNMGSVSPIEMSLLVNSFRKTALAAKVDYIVGPAALMSSINMSGFSISLLLLTPAIEQALLAPAAPAAWQLHPFKAPATVASPELPSTLLHAPSANSRTAALIATTAGLLVEIEAAINSLDAKVGDGDAGSTFALAGKRLLAVQDQLPLNETGDLLLTIGRILAREAGGSSGVLLSILFTAAGNAYTQQPDLGAALLAGLQKVKDYGGAKKGNRTMIDALEPAFEALASGATLSVAAQAARAGADSTKDIVQTTSGRSSYLSEEVLRNIPDPGAEVIARVFEKIATL